MYAFAAKRLLLKAFMKNMSLFFGDKNPSDTTPAIRLIINLNVGQVIIEELDPIFRPIIIDRLTFKPNIRN